MPTTANTVLATPSTHKEKASNKSDSSGVTTAGQCETLDALVEALATPIHASVMMEVMAKLAIVGENWSPFNVKLSLLEVRL
jgi:hypothetical protein